MTLDIGKALGYTGQDFDLTAKELEVFRTYFEGVMTEVEVYRRAEGAGYVITDCLEDPEWPHLDIALTAEDCPIWQMAQLSNGRFVQTDYDVIEVPDSAERDRYVSRMKQTLG